MTNEEARKYILANYFDGDEDTKAFVDGDGEHWVMKFAIEALKNQIPKKPIEDTANLTDFKTFHCPICNKRIVSRLDDEWIAGRPQKYCDNCGQALDWSE